MAARRPREPSSLQPAVPRVQGVDQLPDDLLTRILGALSLRERQLPGLVSRRWHSCAHAPELCRSVELKLNASLPAGSDRVVGREDLPSFGAWLRRHGRHVRHLSLEVFSNTDGVMQQMAQCMSGGAATMPQLEQLLIRYNSPLLISWADGLPPSLRELGLHLGVENCTTYLSSSLSSLTQLTKLMLSAHYTTVDIDVQLPPLLRALAFDGESYRVHGLPPQLSTLTGLDTLVFGQDVNLSGLDACCASMTRLTFLELGQTLDFPYCIGNLTSLQHLAVVVSHSAPEDEDLDGLEPALQRLTGLTALLLMVDYPVKGSPPPALAGLSRLQRLCFLAHDGPLPLGPYSASLRLLGASAVCLNHSTALLAACGSLEHAVVLRGSLEHAAVLRESSYGPFWQWAEQHPSLRCLQVSVGKDPELGRPTSAPWPVAALRQARPQLQIERIYDSSFLALFKWRDPFWNTREFAMNSSESE